MDKLHYIMALLAPEGESGGNGTPGAGEGGEGKGDAAKGKTPTDSLDQFIPEADRKSFAKFKTVGDLARSYRELEGKLGGLPTTHVPIPQADWKPEQWENFYSKLGRPESGDSYIKDLQAPDGIELNQDSMKEALTKLHKAGLTTNQGRAVMELYYGTLQKAQETQTTDLQKQAREAEATLRQQFGEQYAERMASVRRAVQSFGGDDFVAFIDSNPALGNNPLFVNFLAKAGDLLKEDATGNTTPTFNFAVTPADAQRQLADLMIDPVFRHQLDNKYDPKDPTHTQKHEAAVKRYIALHREAAR